MLWSFGAFPLAVVVAAASLGGLLLPASYAREIPSWAAQGIGQDWFDLVVLAPLLTVAGVLAARGSRRARLVLGGAYLYTAYTFVIYAFCVHFNAMFLLYCAGLGLSLYSLASLAGGLAVGGVDAWYAPVTPVKLAGVLQIASAAVFALLWLSDIVPALVSGKPPTSLGEGGFFTNPVQVLDLSLVLPALVVGGVTLLRRRPLGFWLAPVLLAFAALMSLTIGFMVLVMRSRGVPSELVVPIAFGGIAVIDAVALVGLLRRVRRPA
jgi:hypothetical protein